MGCGHWPDLSHMPTTGASHAVGVISTWTWGRKRVVPQKETWEGVMCLAKSTDVYCINVFVTIIIQNQVSNSDMGSRQTHHLLQSTNSSKLHYPSTM